MAIDTDTFDWAIRKYVYDAVFTQGSVPSVAAIATGVAHRHIYVVEALRRLAQRHVIVLQPDSDEILMASPFSAVPTSFQVDVDGGPYWGNCVWDALGILAMLNRDGQVRASCGDCNSAMTLTVRHGDLEASPGVAHFSVPAKHWWDNIVFT